MNSEKQDKIDQIIGSLDGTNKIPAPAFFFTRLKARMEKESPSTSRPWILRPAYALVIAIAVLIINTTLIIKRNERPKNTTPLADTEKFQSIATEYSLNDNLAYDLKQ